MIEIPLFITALIFAVAWGAMENRCWHEAGEAVIANHFKLYHFGMATLFSWVNLLTVNIIFTGFTLVSLLSWVWLMLWDILILDVTWWIIRYYDYKRNYAAAAKQYNEPNMWHLRGDWDNWLGLPLVKGVYWWWWLFAVSLLIIGLTIIELTL